MPHYPEYLNFILNTLVQTMSVKSRIIAYDFWLFFVLPRFNSLKIFVCVCNFRSIPDVLMSPLVFPESASCVPNSLSSKITMENGSTEQARDKEEGERAFFSYTILPSPSSTKMG